MNTRLAPGLLVRGAGALDGVGRQVASLGGRALVVHGGAGFGTIAAAVRTSLTAAGVTAREARHEGVVTRGAIERLTDLAWRGGHDVVLGIGGGRVLDVAKGAADGADVPCVVLPTSPATCAATTAMCVLYDDAGVWSGPLQLRRPPATVVLDPAVLAAAPDRLLAAGVLDALCKVEEVRLAARSAAPGDPLHDAALALCESLAALVDPGTGALAAGLPRAHAERAALAEAVVVLPGLIAGLAGEANKLAAAHAVHNAFTALPGHHRSLHGEIVAFGILVQAALDGAADDVLLERIAWLGRLGVDVSLRGLGCDAYSGCADDVIARIAASPSLRRAFPSVHEGALREMVERVDGLAAS